jgi:hypothetical protein
MRVPAGALAVALALGARARAAPAPRPLEPRRVIRPGEGLFADAFALDGKGQRLAVVRGDGVSFAKLETIDVASGATLSSVDLPPRLAALTGALERLELVPGGKGVVLVAGASGAQTAWLVDGAGRVAGPVGPAAAFGFPRRAPLVVALDREQQRGGQVAYTVTPFQLATLAPAGKPRVYRTAAGGDLESPAPSPPFRLLGFFDGYARALGERPGPRLAVLDTLGGKLGDEAPIADELAWAEAARQRADHPDRLRFAALNQAGDGVDVVDAMGKRQPAQLAVAFGLYDPRSLRDQEGPEAGALYFSLAVDPVNPAAVKRRKPDMPMLDIYAAPAADKAAAPPKPVTRLVAHLFTPRAVSWRAGYEKLVVLKRVKHPARAGDELQIYDIR